MLVIVHSKIKNFDSFIIIFFRNRLNRAECCMYWKHQKYAHKSQSILIRRCQCSKQLTPHQLKRNRPKVHIPIVRPLFIRINFFFSMPFTLILEPKRVFYTIRFSDFEIYERRKKNATTHRINKQTKIHFSIAIGVFIFVTILCISALAGIAYFYRNPEHRIRIMSLFGRRNVSVRYSRVSI